MRRDWDARARENPRSYINWPHVPDEEAAFLASGREDYARYVRPFFEKMRFEPKGKTALEIGCGIGRLARCLADDFREVIGVDVSPEMIARAQAAGIPRARFLAVSGADLAVIDASSIDFVLSFAVFQHVPDRIAIERYIEETARVLRSGGVFRLHMKGLWTLPLGHILIEAGISNTRIAFRNTWQRFPFVRVRFLDTWQGRSIPPPEALRLCAQLGLEVTDVEAPWTNMMWVGGRKK